MGGGDVTLGRVGASGRGREEEGGELLLLLLLFLADLGVEGFSHLFFVSREALESLRLTDRTDPRTVLGSGMSFSPPLSQLPSSDNSPSSVSVSFLLADVTSKKSRRVNPENMGLYGVEGRRWRRVEVVRARQAAGGKEGQGEGVLLFLEEIKRC